MGWAESEVRPAAPSRTPPPTQVFHLLNALVCALRAAAFAAHGAVLALPAPLCALALDAPGLLFFTTYTLLVLFWAEIYHQARSLPTGGLRPAFLAVNGAVYGVQAGLWAWAAAAGHHAGGAPRAASLAFLALASAAAAAGFIIYGGRLFFMLRRFPIESRGRRKKLREVGAVAAVCAACFSTRAALAAWAAAAGPGAGLDVAGHPGINGLYYGLTELAPSALVLFILRRLPPRRAAEGYTQISG